MFLTENRVLNTAFSTCVLLALTACSHAPANADTRQLATSASTQESKCEVSPQDREALLNLDYKSFDQTLPDGGWRKYQSCIELTRGLVDDYVTRHAATLEKHQLDILVWHSGQLSGFLGDYSQAIASMEQTFKSTEKPTDAFLWNPYAKATIAFLKKDKSALLSGKEPLSLKDLVRTTI